MEAASTSCGMKVTGACQGGNPRTHWWTPAVREAVKSKKEAFQAMLGHRSPESIERYRMAKRAAAGEVTRVKA